MRRGGDTRRRVSCDLVRALCRNYEQQVTDLFSGYIAHLLQQHAASPAANWKAKDAAIYLVIALTLKGGTAKLGATQTNQLVNLLEFFGSHVLPELQAAMQPNAQPILVADAIKFVSTFRVQLPATAYAQVVPLLTHLLTHRQNQLAVHGASCGALHAP